MIRSAVVTASLVLTLSAPLDAAAQGGDGTLTIGVAQFPSTWHPSIEPSSAKSYVLDMARRPFTTFNADWELVCLLCTELPTLENGLAVLEETPDGGEGIAITYTIQPGATWGDGTPITVDDVVFTWEVGRHPQSAVANIELYETILSIDAVDDRTFVLHMSEVDYNYNAINDLRVLPAHLERPVFEADPVAYPSRTLYNTDTTNPGLYFGPYLVEQVESGAFVVLTPNPTWYGDPPHFDRIVIRVIENTAAMEANLLSGAIDMIAGELGITIDQSIAFEERHGDDYRILFQPGLIYEHIDLNLDNPMLADRRVRQGLLYALDREALVERLFDGRQPVADTNTSELDWIHDPEVYRYAHDPERAAALFDAAGFDRIVDGVRQSADGQRLSFELMTTAGNRSRELVQQVLQEMWRQSGVEITIRNEPARVFFGATTSRRQFTAMAMFAWVSSPENVPRTTLHSSHIPTEENNWAGQNYTGWDNPVMDVLIDAAETELDRERRREIWRWIQAVYADELPALPLYFRSNTYIMPTWLAGVVPTGHQYGTSQTVEYWHRVE